MNKNKIDNGNLPSRGKEENSLQFTIEKKILIQIIILILTSFFIVSHITEESVRQVYCSDNHNQASGWVSAENSHQYWVVSDMGGKVMEFDKRSCSIDG